MRLRSKTTPKRKEKNETTKKERIEIQSCFTKAIDLISLISNRFSFVRIGSNCFFSYFSLHLVCFDLLSRYLG